MNLHPTEMNAAVLVPTDAAAALRRPTFTSQRQVDWLFVPRLNRLVARGRGARYLSVPIHANAPGAGEGSWPLRFHLDGAELPGDGQLQFVLAGGWIRFTTDAGEQPTFPLERLTPEEAAKAWPDFVRHRPARAASEGGRAA